MIEIISKPWPWYVSGPMITLVMFSMLYLGKRFGVSSNLRTMCTMAGAGRYADYFKFDWKNDIWNLVFILGAVLGGFISREFLTDDPSIAISAATAAELATLGVALPGSDYVPTDVFNWEVLFSFKGLVMMVFGGMLIGFGTRYGDGCTSGHGISGLSNLQLPSLIAVIGFFVGGLLVTFFILPYLLTL
ncbi:MAG: YeeE/YedE thiosulfate transporter family protein [Cyclobacteriaceae bacterium]